MNGRWAAFAGVLLLVLLAECVGTLALRALHGPFTVSSAVLAALIATAIVSPAVYLWVTLDLARHERAEQRLQRAEEQLRRSKEELERLVDERTAELRRAYEATARREREIASLLKHLPDYIVRLDRDMRYTYVSPTLTSVTGVPPEGFIGKRRSEMRLPPEYLERANALLNYVLTYRTEARGEVMFRTPAGPRYFDAIVVPELAPDGSLEAVLGVSRDITELKEAEKRAGLLEAVTGTISAARDYRSALEGILRTVCQAFDWPIGEIWVPTADGKALEYGSVWSSDPEKFKQFIESGRASRHASGEGLAGKAWQRRGPVWMDDIAPGPGLSRIDTAVGTGQRSALAVPVFAGEELLLVMIFGSYEPKRWERDPLRGIVQAAAQQMGGYILRKRAEEEREKFRQEFLAAQKMEAVGRLAGGVAHDFANILSAVVGTSELILSEMKPSDAHFADLELIRASSLHGVSLIRQLLAIGRGRAPEAGQWDLNDVLSGMEQLLARVLGEDIRLELRLGKGLPAVSADKSHLEQIVMNLVVNARDAMPHGGKLIVETAVRELGSQAVSMGLIPGDYIRLSVSDTGLGMPPEVKERIFEPFFTTKGPGEGTGLGLATVYHIVTQAGGRATVDSEPGQGTTFTLYFPKAGAPRRRPPPPAPPEAPPDWRHGAEALLLVEDDPVVRAIARQLLKRAGYAVHSAGSAEEALALARGLEGKIDLLLTDVQLQEMDGFALAQGFRKLYPEVPVAFLSGFTSHELAEQAKGVEGFKVLISKPFTMDSLLKGVRQALIRKVGAAG